MKRFEVISGSDFQVTNALRKLQDTIGVENVEVENLHTYWNGAMTIVTIVVSYEYRD